MNRFTYILMIIWGCLAILSFGCAFFAPLFIKIIGLTFGGMNILIILAWVITYLQSLLLEKNITKNGLLLQTEDEETYKEETSAE